MHTSCSSANDFLTSSAALNVLELSSARQSSGSLPAQKLE
jgi:hypothetical protein